VKALRHGRGAFAWELYQHYFARYPQKATLETYLETGSSGPNGRERPQKIPVSGYFFNG